ncbi:hypothetical protein QBC35DRAFT_484695 [Podospora australis]|uniref:HNH domain-containing protein n=1 Tax=Podospora australis TaxID=1536484 RepID=A0AAN7AM62_9PEZI|nr:hypothetical protein QBC35DRAFT_484695 [Podospora australis]
MNPSEIPDEYSANYSEFRDILSAVLIEKLTAPSTVPKNHHTSPKTKRRAKRSSSTTPSSPAAPATDNDAEDLAEFTEYIATSVFSALPKDLQSLSHRTFSSSVSTYPLPLSPETVSSLLVSLDPSILDSLTTYLSADNEEEALTTFFTPILSAYISHAITPPPAPSSTRGKVTECEICGRDWINLTYHHLIPRMVHDKVVKRGWHPAEDLQNVAWLCGACHGFVHRFAGHEDLARRYYTVELLLREEKIQGFADWVGRLRWKGLGAGRSRRGP